VDGGGQIRGARCLNAGEDGVLLGENGTPELPGMTSGDTISTMSSAKVAISLDPQSLREVDQLVDRGIFPSRSKLIQDAIAEKLQRLRRVRLARECAKLKPEEERAAAEEQLAGEVEWPEY
jgi:Arc/MetJ-type ribon-helix-helix transcriptional regulator